MNELPQFHQRKLPDKKREDKIFPITECFQKQLKVDTLLVYVQ